MLTHYCEGDEIVKNETGGALADMREGSGV
jgi:hypothetical protein